MFSRKRGAIEELLYSNFISRFLTINDPYVITFLGFGF